MEVGWLVRLDVSGEQGPRSVVVPDKKHRWEWNSWNVPKPTKLTVVWQKDPASWKGGSEIQAIDVYVAKLPTGSLFAESRGGAESWLVFVEA